MRRAGPGDIVPAEKWLLLIHQLGTKPAYARVKTWRRLQGLGAVAVKNTVYVLPASEQNREDFEWLLKDIAGAGGEAMICEAHLVDGLSDSDVRELFNAAREADYAGITAEARALSANLKGSIVESGSNSKVQISRLRARYIQTSAIDFFGANGRETADGAIQDLEKCVAGASEASSRQTPAPRFSPQDLKRRVWVTRQGVHIDRIACAWLTRRFIDSDAVFKFVRAKDYQPAAKELRFDMFDAEFTHDADRCSFEVLLAHSGLQEPALQAIAEIVHDIDLKDEKFGRDEAGGVKTLINGICVDAHVDEERLVRGAAIFDSLYGAFRNKRKPKADRER
jgi:hypothetical protein